MDIDLEDRIDSTRTYSTHCPGLSINDPHKAATPIPV